MKDFASRAKPLRLLTVKATTFKWTSECQATFDHLRKCLTSAPTLAMPNWTQPFIIDTDASDARIGTVYSQLDKEGNEHVVAYASRLLSKAECNYCVACKELLSVVSFLQHFRQYLLTQPFTIRTGHGALTWMQQFRNPECMNSIMITHTRDTKCATTGILSYTSHQAFGRLYIQKSQMFI